MVLRAVSHPDTMTAHTTQRAKTATAVAAPVATLILHGNGVKELIAPAKAATPPNVVTDTRLLLDSIHGCPLLGLFVSAINGLRVHWWAATGGAAPHGPVSTPGRGQMDERD